MSRFYTSLGNLPSAYRLAVLAACSLATWLALENTSRASCGDYVQIANPQFGGPMASHSGGPASPLPFARTQRQSSPSAPCRGPNCGQNAPALPLSPAPLVVRTPAEQWAVLASLPDDNSPGAGFSLAETAERPAAGFPSLVKRPPRG